MKHFLLVIFLLLTKLVSGQTLIYELLTEDEGSVMQVMKNHNYTFVEHGKSDDIKYDSYRIAKGTHLGCYFNKKGECYMLLFVTPISTLSDNLDFLNKNYKNIDKTHWVDEKNTMVINLYSEDHDKNSYLLSYTVSQLIDEVDK